MIPLAAILVPISLLGMGLGLIGSRRLRETTLRHPAYWVVVHFASAGILPWVASDGMRFLLKCSAILPFISLLGSRRPHDGAWHFVVGTLWIVIGQPGWQSLVLGGNFGLTDARLILLWALLLGCVVTYLPTKHWPSALALAVGMGLLFANELFGSNPGRWIGEVVGEAMLLIGTIIVLATSRPAAGGMLTTFWLDYRDSFGAIWALRLLERLRSVAQLKEWQLSLRWNGFADESEWTAEQGRIVGQEMKNVVRRFGSQTSIEERLTGFRKAD